MILGASEARDEAGRPVPLGGQRLRALLAALALRAPGRAPVSPQTLISEVWADTEPDAMPENAPAALQALVGRLRRALGKDAVESLHGGYRLRVDPERDEVDLLRFERLAAEGEHALEAGDAERAATVLREGLALWRGPALADLPDRARAAARAEALRHAALHRRLTADLALGRAERTLPELRQLAPENPLDEPLQALYLRALHESGRTAEALAVYESVRKGIASRLGADPGAELRALHAELLAASVAHDAPGHPARNGPPQGAGTRERRAGAVVPPEANRPPAPGTPPLGDAPSDPSPTDPDPSVPDPSVPDPSLPDASDPAPSAADPSAADPSEADPATPGLSATGPSAGGAATADSPAAGRSAVGTRPVGTRPLHTGPVGTGPLGSGLPTTGNNAQPEDIGAGYPGPTFASPGAAPAPPPSPPGNLRARLTSFVGRETDIATITDDLATARLVTLTGPGGSGKTRLAEQVAATVATADPAAYPDGTWLVELASLDHPAAVPGVVLSALGRRVTALTTAATEAARSLNSEQDATALLIEHLEHRSPLLILDNCEHLIHAAATLAETLLAHCPGLTVLATSREPLGVPGETVRSVEPLPPAPALRLFADRAAAARPGFHTSEDPEAVAEICRRLDGLPLAIELAAARLRSLTPRQIADRLDDRFRLLTSGSRTVLPRQQTLRAVVDWSWDLLDERERTVVRRLSVFAGGCTLSAAEHVCADEPPDTDPDTAGGPDAVVGPDTNGGPNTARGPIAARCPGEHPRPAEPTHPTGRTRPEEPIRPDDVLDLLSALVDKSILVADQPPALTGTGVRYRMLETIHDYARERAAEHEDDREAAEARHTAQILRFATAAEPRLRSAEQLSWLPRIEADLDNIRAALYRALLDRDRETVVALVRAAGWFWWLRNYRDEGARWVQAALSLLPATRAERDAEEELLYREFQLLWYFLLAEHHTQQLLTDPHHRAVARELIETFREPGPAAARFPGMLWPFAAYLVEGSKGVAVLMETSVANCRRYSEPWELALALLFRTHVRMDAPGGLHHTKEDLPEISALAESTGDRWLLGQMCGLRAEVALQEGRYDDARAECETALRHAQQLGALTEMPVLLARIADIWFRRGDTEQAERLAARAIADAERVGVRDAQALSLYVRAVAAAEADEPARARQLYQEARKSSSVGTPPAMFEVMLRVLDARITAGEGAAHLPEALRKIHAALLTALESAIPEHLTSQALLTAGYVLHLAGHHALAVRFADAAHVLRGDLPASVPELRLDGTIRAYASGAPDPDPAADSAQGSAPDQLTATEAADSAPPTDAVPGPVPAPDHGSGPVPAPDHGSVPGPAPDHGSADAPAPAPARAEAPAPVGASASAAGPVPRDPGAAPLTVDEAIARLDKLCAQLVAESPAPDASEPGPPDPEEPAPEGPDPERLGPEGPGTEVG
nr:BTAD domain-containing putative transcriptional regulator [Streptomyces albus]